MTEMQFRHEYKHILNAGDAILLRARLSAVMEKDPHVGEDGFYTIRSLYFDTPSDKALREKVSGVSEREKFRIRIYNDDLSFIRLEKKVKKGGLGYKVSAPLSKEETERLIAGDYSWMATKKDGLVVELYSKMQTELLRPKTIVQYRREPFIHTAGNVRITLDYDVRTGLLSTDLLNPDTPLIPASPGTVILEVKYDNFLPTSVRDVIQLLHRGESAFSKYEACRRYL
ncbi:MAG: polyphosphate polymerase domain-containing protein [Spirochaetales bacterium]|nr:polyphosphate polymerase domain-containing protein [Candidatus Physcosoma equi]